MLDELDVVTVALPVPTKPPVASPVPVTRPELDEPLIGLLLCPTSPPVADTPVTLPLALDWEIVPFPAPKPISPPV